MASAEAADEGAGTSVIVPLGLTDGDTHVVIGCVDRVTGTGGQIISAIADSGGTSSYTLQDSLTSTGDTSHLEIWSTAAGAGTAANGVKITLSANVYGAFFVGDYAGALRLGRTQQSGGRGTAFDDSLTTQDANNAVVAGLCGGRSNTATLSAGTGNLRQYYNGVTINYLTTGLVDDTASTASLVKTTATSSVAQRWIGDAIELRATAAADTWPNDPYEAGTSGWQLITDYDWTDAVPTASGSCEEFGSAGWALDNGPDAALTKVYDATAPYSSPDSVLQFYYDSGFVAGSAPATITFGSLRCGPGSWPNSASTSQTYMGFWFKYSSNWYGEQSGVNKLTELFDNTDNGSYVQAGYGTGTNPLYTWEEWESPGDSSGAGSMSNNVGNTEITLNTWHLFEVLWTYTGSVGGINRFTATRWLDGVEQSNYTNLPVVGTGMGCANVYPNWGGGGDTLKVSGGIKLWISHIRITGHS